LQAHAREFLQHKQWPKHFLFAIDPDYTMINAYGLRWDSPGETSYPSTFLLDRKGDCSLCEDQPTAMATALKALDILTELKNSPPD